MTRVFEILYRERDGRCLVPGAGTPVGPVLKVELRAADEGEARRIFEGQGLAVVSVKFSRFESTGLPGEGVRIAEVRECLGLSRKAANRLAKEVDRIGSGRGTVLLLAGLERRVRERMVRAGRAIGRRGRI